MSNSSKVPDDHWIHKALKKSGIKPAKLEYATKTNDKNPVSADPLGKKTVGGPTSPKEVAEAASGSGAPTDAPPTTGVGVPVAQRSTFDFVKTLGQAANSGLTTSLTKPAKQPKGQ